MSGAVARMDFELTKFNAEIAKVNNMAKRNSETIIRTNARRLIKRAAYRVPFKTGRACAGFWPAAIALQMTSIYNVKGPPMANRGEGWYTDQIKTNNPTFMFRNSVPYIMNAGRPGIGWWIDAVQSVIQSLKKDIEKDLLK